MTNIAKIGPQPNAPASEWANHINACWRASFSGVMRTGQLLNEAKAALAHGEFLQMIENKLDFSARRAEMIMRISSDKRIANPKYASLLPQEWTNLYEITKLDDREFEAAIEAKVIRPDMTGRELKQAQKKKARAQKEASLGLKIDGLPTEKFGVIVADPPWKYKTYSEETGMDRAADNHYPTQDTAKISTLDVRSIAADDCVLFLWATAPMLPDALTCMIAWGFTYKTHMIWDKEALGTGYWFRNQHELLLVGTRGKTVAPAMGDQVSSVRREKRGKHSAKPEWFLEMIEGYFPTIPKIELNRRGAPRPGWKAWGNEATVTAPPPPRESPIVTQNEEPQCLS